MYHNVDRGEILTAVEEAGLEEGSIRWAYEGRGMSGDTCFGLVTDDEDFLRFVIQLARQTDQDLEWLCDYKSDNMGLSSIFYWPGISFESFEDEDEEGED